MGAARRPVEDQRPWVNVLSQVQHKGSEGTEWAGGRSGPSELAASALAWTTAGQ